MIIVRFIGGLGNQMFQYSLYRSLEKMGLLVKADLTDFDTYELHNGFELETVFNLKVKVASGKEIHKIKDSSLKFIFRLRRKLFGQKKSHIYQDKFDLSSFDKRKDLYLDGFWQSKDFVNNNLSVFHKEFLFKTMPNKLNSELIKEIEQNNSISIHVRRGDYLKLQEVYTMCSKDYYQNSISFFNEKFTKPKYFVFSNDINWCKKKLNFYNSEVVFVTHNSGVMSFEDLRLMIKCKHNIIANSSFSWWGAVLNESDEKIVVCPEKWFVDAKRNENIFIPENWRKISNS